MRRLGASGIIGLGILFLTHGVRAQELAAIHPEPPVEGSSVFMRVMVGRATAGVRPLLRRISRRVRRNVGHRDEIFLPLPNA